METLALEIRLYVTYAFAALAVVLMAASAVMWSWKYLKQAVDRFMSASPVGKAIAAVALGVAVVYGGSKGPVAPAVRGITLEPIVLTSTNAVLKYSVDSDVGSSTTVSNRTIWIYHKSVDGLWMQVMKLDRQTGSSFETTVSGFFPDQDRDWKVVISGNESEDE